MNVAILTVSLLSGQALEALIKSVPQLHVVGVAQTVLDCLAIVKGNHVSSLVVEEELLTTSSQPYLVGAQLAQGLGVVVVGREERSAEDFQPLTVSYLGKGSSAHELCSVLTALPELEPTPERTRARQNTPLGLSAREREVVELVAKGMSNRQIAEVTGLQDQSIKNLVSAIMRRLNMDNRTQLALRYTTAKAER